MEMTTQNLNKTDEHKDQQDETKSYLNGRVIHAVEACWNFFGFPTHDMSPSVVPLHVHAQYKFQNIDKFNNNIMYCMDTTYLIDSTLKAYFELNSDETHNKNVLTHTPKSFELYYDQIPQYYKFQKGQWIRRSDNYKQQRPTLGRLLNVSPQDSERYHLSILLTYVKGAKSFKDLKTVDGKLYETFKEACGAHGFIFDDTVYFKSLHEASTFQMPQQLREFFTNLLIHCVPQQPNKLWEYFKIKLSEDFTHRNKQMPFPLTTEEILDLTKMKINEMLQQQGKNLKDYGIKPPKFVEDLFTSNANSSQIQNQQYVKRTIKSLNPDQLKAYQGVLQMLLPFSNENYVHIEAPAGTGKTHVANLILAHVRGNGKTAIAVSSIGIASLLLENAATFHKKFRSKLVPTRQFYLDAIKCSQLVKEIKSASVILIDEVFSLHKYHVEALNRTLQAIMQKPHMLFGGLNVVTMGDLQQTLPVPITKSGFRTNIVNCCLTSSDIWQKVVIYKLTINERIKRCLSIHATVTEKNESLQHARYLLNIGSGKEKVYDEIGDDMIRIPNDLVSTATNLKQFCSWVFDDFKKNYKMKKYYKGRAVLSPRNVDVDEINSIMFDQNPETSRTYAAKNTCLERKNREFYTDQIMNEVNMPGFPKSKLELKPYTPIILLRNLDTKRGLANGTKLLVDKLGKFTVVATILNGNEKHIGNSVILFRVKLEPKEGTIAFKMVRFQFPICIAFGFTTNKVQGQTCNKVGLYLPKPVFSHGQLYVAMSRCGMRINFRIFVVNGKNQGVFMGHEGVYTKNIVWKEVFQ